MNVVNFNERSCERYRPYFDAYLDSELLVETTQDVLQHTASCTDCTRILESRARLKQLVKNAVLAEEAPLALAAALRDRFRTERRSKSMLIATKPISTISSWRKALAQHLPEYVIEGSCLGLFMVSACAFGTLFSHPDSIVVRLVHDPTMLRVFMGLAMGTTAVALIYSSFGKRSGAHMNPAATLTFLRLGKIEPTDAFFYVAAQFAGAIAGVGLASIALGAWLSHPSVDYVVTLPGRYGYWWAFVAEAVMTFLLMSVILRVSNTPKINRFTGLFAGLLVVAFISVEAPISGMSMNPARTLGSAFYAGNWTSVGIYFTGPPLGMLLAAQLYLRLNGASRVLCAKLHHDNRERCIFKCNYPV